MKKHILFTNHPKYKECPMKKMTLITLLFFVSAATANNVVEDIDYQQEEPIFYCKAPNKKIIQLTKYEEVYIYRFGKNLDKPEIRLENHIEDVKRTSETQNGSETKRAYELTTGPYIYRIFSGIPKVPEENGVEVFKHRKRIARIECSGYVHIFE